MSRFVIIANAFLSISGNFCRQCTFYCLSFRQRGEFNASHTQIGIYIRWKPATGGSENGRKGMVKRLVMEMNTILCLFTLLLVTSGSCGSYLRRFASPLDVIRLQGRLFINGPEDYSK